MKKMSKRLVALLLAAVMVMGLNITAFANTNDTHQVTIYFQKVTRGTNGTAGTATSLIGNSLTTSCITVEVQHGASYRDALNKACNENDLISDAEWSGQYLNSIDINDRTYENNGEYTGERTYEGSSWMYFDNNPNYIPDYIDDYPNLTMTQKQINNDTSFTLSYETMIYTW